jgi:ABC-type amino acid transport substrate-binding protein
MSINEELDRIKYFFDYTKGKVISEQRTIPDPNILPDCFTALLKSNINMVAFDKYTLQDETLKRINSVDITFDPDSPSDELGLTIVKDGKPFCFVKK